MTLPTDIYFTIALNTPLTVHGVDSVLKLCRTKKLFCDENFWRRLYQFKSGNDQMIGDSWKESYILLLYKKVITDEKIKHKLDLQYSGIRDNEDFVDRFTNHLKQYGFIHKHSVLYASPKILGTDIEPDLHVLSDILYNRGHGYVDISRLQSLLLEIYYLFNLSLKLKMLSVYTSLLDSYYVARGDETTDELRQIIRKYLKRQ